MRYILFVEGETEFKVLPNFFKRWLDREVGAPVDVYPVKFKGWAEMLKDAPKKARLHLSSAKQKKNPAVVIGLTDIHGPVFPKPGMDLEDKKVWLKKKFEDAVGLPEYHHYHAVHELEAWLLSDPSIFPRSIQDAFGKNIGEPEKVNTNHPPKAYLRDLYTRKMGSTYKEVVHGTDLFAKLDPLIAYRKCPSLKTLLDELLSFAKAV
ncbi:MAG TPA: DUF4276 family protein [Candidatus Melainabacteria bacterium]|nr:DUF4276 family protein [Candidatus Melainabacteria bacterium]HIN63459.1 DUF4276 family protein [Candidatus Obscuribacterales bacterium]